MSMDEEYLGMILPMKHGADEHPTGAEVLTEKVFKAIDRRPSFAQSFMDIFEVATIEVSNGLIVPNVGTLAPDWSRIERVLKKIVRGLYFHHNGRRLPDDIVIHVVPSVPQVLFQSLAKDMTKEGNAFVGASLVQETVGYLGMGEGFDTMWLISFYQCHGACMFTLSVGRVERLREKLQRPRR